MQRLPIVDRRLGGTPRRQGDQPAAPSPFTPQPARVTWRDPFDVQHGIEGIQVSEDEDLMRLHALLSLGHRAEPLQADSAVDDGFAAR